LLAEVDTYHPDVVLFDLGWEPTLAAAASRSNPEPRSSLESLAELRESGLSVVALLPHEAYTHEAWTAGARGLLLRQIDTDRLMAALLAVFRGLVALDPA
jgi:DNA-binding NarL/FixJ family response regulator